MADLEAGSRQERQLMRQRGAGNRQIEGIDFGFGFTFNTPSTVGRARSRTPTQDPATVTRRAAETFLSPRHSTRNAVLQQALSPHRDLAHGLQPRGSIGSQHDQGELPRKRRRLSEMSNITAATPKSSRIASIRKDQENISPDVFNNVNGETEVHALPRPPVLVNCSPLFSTRHEEPQVNENQSVLAKPSTKKRKRKSIGQQSLFRKRKSGTPRNELPTPSATSGSNVSRQLLPEPSTLSEQRSPSPVSSLFAGGNPLPVDKAEDTIPHVYPAGAESDDEVPQNTPSIAKLPPIKRRKRKSVIQGTRKRKTKPQAAQQPTPIPNRLEHIKQTPLHATEFNSEMFDTGQADVNRVDAWQQPLDSEADEDETHVFDSAQHRPGPSRNMGRHEVPDDDDNDDEIDEPYIPDEASAEPESPMKKSIQKPANTRRKTARSAGRPQPTASSSGTVPVLTYRTTNVKALPTIIEEHEHLDPGDVSDPDELAALIAPTVSTKSTPNAIDVLAQACREAMDSGIAKVKGASSLTGPQRKDQIEALRSLRSSLDNSWFQVSQVLDQRMHMESRLRKSRREKAELQTRWLEIRRQRDVLDLRKDAIRRRHWENETLARRRFDASEAAAGLEEALMAGTEPDDDAAPAAASLEYLIRDVLKDVSNSADETSGSILETVQSFNAHLKRLAAQFS